MILPGYPINKLNAFKADSLIGDRVFSKSLNKVGTISSIKETSADWIEIHLDFDGKEIKQSLVKDAVYLG